jgi:hypothetical protein
MPTSISTVVIVTPPPSPRPAVEAPWAPVGPKRAVKRSSQSTLPTLPTRWAAVSLALRGETATRA